MSVVGGIKKFFGFSPGLAASSAYDRWAGLYDHQPHNLMLHLDAIIFRSFLDNVNLSQRAVADIGCGTGRHWPSILGKNPARLAGYDVSHGMIRELKQKFPTAEVSAVGDDDLKNIPSGSFHLIISTLTIAHIRDPERAINAWCRIAKKNAEIILTDFHPELLSRGGRRTFTAGDKQLSIRNYIHPLSSIQEHFLKNGFRVVAKTERFIDQTVEKFYRQQDALHIYKKFIGSPLIYGIHLKRNHADQ